MNSARKGTNVDPATLTRCLLFFGRFPARSFWERICHVLSWSVGGNRSYNEAVVANLDIGILFKHLVIFIILLFIL